MQFILSHRSSHLEIDGILFEINRKKIKHLYFRVYPEHNKVVVSAPYHLDRKTLDRAILAKKNWFQKKIAAPVQKQGPEPISYLTKDSVWVKGKPKALRIFYTTDRSKVLQVNDSQIHVFLKQGKSAVFFEKTITNWLRQELLRQIEEMVIKWEPVLHVKVNEFRIRKMKTRWGSCNFIAGRIWLNAVLIHFSPVYLEYVVVHEMVHLLEKRHNKRFKQYMDQFIPQWRTLKKQMDLLSF